jgi:hypothetical protein
MVKLLRMCNGLSGIIIPAKGFLHTHTQISQARAQEVEREFNKERESEINGSSSSSSREWRKFVNI